MVAHYFSYSERYVDTCLYGWFFLYAIFSCFFSFVLCWSGWSMDGEWGWEAFCIMHTLARTSDECRKPCTEIMWMNLDAVEATIRLITMPVCVPCSFVAAVVSIRLGDTRSLSRIFYFRFHLRPRRILRMSYYYLHNAEKCSLVVSTGIPMKKVFGATLDSLAP